MKRTLTWRRTAAAAVLPLALTGLSACGGDDAEKADDTSSTSSQTDTEESDTEESDAPEAGAEVSTDEFIGLVTGAFEKATTAKLTMSSESAGAPMVGEGEVDFSSNPMAMKFLMPDPAGGGGESEVIMVDSVMYMQMAEAQGKYVKIDFSDMGGGALGSMMADSMDPSKQAELMERGLVSATFIGEEDVDGEDMDHYSATVDGEDALKSIEGFEDLPKSAIPDDMTYDIWFDDEGLVRKIVFDMAEAGGATEMKMDDWGTDVSIEAPPADQVTTMADMMGSMG
ncbi:hypothetical protein I601_2871 [Nocardioides dokdonensis FR1436]|uniref:Lipoprotein n=1 Tax=Nocardioides dokdonensis FR1436 TaxID=1300347 RepID=A0A1A9GLT0_9ACTN|nr:hypothetical protein [Nocardioides dokdonensis]ANH39287.1 hypothetical protein I601_2871 [Nocardioides dokdonensis FR1436]